MILEVPVSYIYGTHTWPSLYLQMPWRLNGIPMVKTSREFPSKIHVRLATNIKTGIFMLDWSVVIFALFRNRHYNTLWLSDVSTGDIWAFYHGSYIIPHKICTQVCCGLFWFGYTMLFLGIFHVRTIRVLTYVNMVNSTRCDMAKIYPFFACLLDCEYTAVEVWELISNFITHCTVHVITYPCWH